MLQIKNRKGVAETLLIFFISYTKSYLPGFLHTFVVSLDIGGIKPNIANSNCVSTEQVLVNYYVLHGRIKTSINHVFNIFWGVMNFRFATTSCAHRH